MQLLEGTKEQGGCVENSCILSFDLVRVTPSFPTSLFHLFSPLLSHAFLVHPGSEFRPFTREPLAPPEPRGEQRRQREHQRTAGAGVVVKLLVYLHTVECTDTLDHSMKCVEFLLVHSRAHLFISQYMSLFFFAFFLLHFFVFFCANK